MCGRPVNEMGFINPSLKHSIPHPSIKTSRIGWVCDRVVYFCSPLLVYLWPGELCSLPHQA